MYRPCMQEAEIEIARRTVLSNAAGLAMLALVRSCFAQASAENAYQGRSRTMDVKRNGSRPPSKGPEAWFTGTVRVDPLFKWGTHNVLVVTKSPSNRVPEPCGTPIRLAKRSPSRPGLAGRSVMVDPSKK